MGVVRVATQETRLALLEERCQNRGRAHRETREELARLNKRIHELRTDVRLLSQRVALISAVMAVAGSLAVQVVFKLWGS